MSTARDYFDYSCKLLDTASEVIETQTGSFYLRGVALVGSETLGLTNEELKDLHINEHPAVQVGVRDNGDMGDGFWLDFTLPNRKEENAHLFSVELDPQQVRILIAALEGGLRMREAQGRGRL